MRTYNPKLVWLTTTASHNLFDCKSTNILPPVNATMEREKAHSGNIEYIYGHTGRPLPLTSQEILLLLKNEQCELLANIKFDVKYEANMVIKKQIKIKTLRKILTKCTLLCKLPARVVSGFLSGFFALRALFSRNRFCKTVVSKFCCSHTPLNVCSKRGSHSLCRCR